MYTMTVYVAARGTPINEKPNEPSAAGHMWFTLKSGQIDGFRSYGFAPLKSKGPSLPVQGYINTRDNEDYLSYAYSRRIEITEEQYNKLKAFGDDPKASGFDTSNYWLLNNSCVDFVWKALAIAGVNRTGYEGSLIPVANIEDLRKFVELSSLEIKRVDDFLKTAFPLSWDKDSLPGIDYECNRYTTQALNWVPPRRDPLVLDLDGNGITTSGINPSAPILFDQDGDGIKNATGWIASGEAIVVRDLNGNGTIDSGREIFGDNTVLTTGAKAGQTAANGFEALADLDSNNDGKFNASDAAFSSVKLWKDFNQNGRSDAGELFSFADLNVQSINIGATASNLDLGGGNTQTFTGSFTTSGGATGAAGTAQLAGSLLLSNNNFYREFTDDPALTTVAMNSPDMKGSGLVRDLRAAMSLGTTQSLSLQTQVTQFATDTRDGQLLHLNELIQSWGSTSSMPTSIQTSTTLANTAAGVGSITAVTKFSQTNPDLYAKIIALEQFNGQTILDKWVRSTGNGNSAVVYSPEQETLIGQAYDALKDSVYSALIMQTRLKPYLESIGLTVDSTGVKFNTASMISIIETQTAINPIIAITDLIDLHKYTENSTKGLGFNLYENIQYLLEGVEITPEISTVLLNAKIILNNFQNNNSNYTLLGNTGDDILISGYGENTTIIGGSGNDTIKNQGNGINYLSGGAGNDNITFSFSSKNTISGGNGNDIIQSNYIAAVNDNNSINTFTGGSGNDTFLSGSGADTYIFNLGDGDDIIKDAGGIGGWSGGIFYASGKDTLIFGEGIFASYVTANRNGNNLVINIKDPNNPLVSNSITIENWDDRTYRIEQFKFSDGLTLTAADMIELSMKGSDVDSTYMLWADTNRFTGGSGNEIVTANGDDVFINGGAGNDTIKSDYSNATLDGGAGNDIITARGLGTNILLGGEGNDIITFSFIAKNTVNGGDGNDVIQSNYITSANYYDSINTFTGDTGNDIFLSGSGADTYIFNLGDGDDIIKDAGGIGGWSGGIFYVPGKDTLNFGEGIVASYVTASRNGDNLVINIKDPNNPLVSNSITIENWDDRTYRIEQFKFSDGLTLTAADMMELSMKGSDVGGTYMLWADTDQFTGGFGNEIVTANGDDVVINGGAGNDTIKSDYSNATLDGGTGNDIITARGLGTNILLGGEGDDIITFSFSAKNTVNGGDGNDVIQSNYIDSANYYDSINTFTGGTGNDTFLSGSGADTYIFNLGDGDDIIKDTGGVGGWSGGIFYASGKDTLIFGEGIFASYVTANRNGNNLVINIKDPNNPLVSNSITIENWDDRMYRIEQFKFNDGLTLTAADMMELSMKGSDVDGTYLLWADTNRFTGGSGNEIVTANGDDVVINGGAGNDTIKSDYSNATLDGGIGNDIITARGIGTNILLGGEGNDIITFSFSAKNTVNGGDGNDVIQSNYIASANYNDSINTFTGGTGNDTFLSGSGADTYIFNLGDGEDLIKDAGGIGDWSGGVFYGPGKDSLIFGDGISENDITASRLWFKQTGNNLEVSLIGTTDKVVIADWYLGTQYHVEEFKTSDGKILLDTQVQNLVNAMAGFAPPAAGQTTLPASYESSLMPVITANWH